MDARPRCLEEQLHRRELELAELRGDLYELRRKFAQLERAFVTNLQWQRRLEAGFNLLQLESRDLQKSNEEYAAAKAEVNSRLVQVTRERDHWRDAFVSRKEDFERNRIDRDEAVEAVRCECEGILKETRETAERHFSDLVRLYEGAREKIRALQEQTEVFRDNRRTCANRASALANLLETLRRFDVSVSSVCSLTAEALRNLTETGDAFQNGLDELRQLTWATNDRKIDTGQDLLRKQNLVLREVVKNLKRKEHAGAKHEPPNKDASAGGSEIDQATKDSENNRDSRDTTRRSTDKPSVIEKPSPVEPSLQRDSARVRLSNSAQIPDRDCDPGANRAWVGRELAKSANGNESRGPTERESDGGRKRKSSDDNPRVLRVESHLNGVFCEEYVIKFSDEREMKIKHSPKVAAGAAELKLRFASDEQEYEESGADGVLVLLRNVRAIVELKRTGVNCATQTTRTRVCDEFAQTRLTGTKVFSRLNAGATMLNSEKRAIERSLCNLERTVSALKFNALGQARCMIGKGPGYAGNDEFFECVRLLTR